MSVRYELFAAGSASPDDLWGLVGEPRRLPEWTDVRQVEVGAEPLVVGTAVTVREDSQTLHFTVTTLEERLIEGIADTERGRIGIGIRVVRDPLGSRLILAGFHEPAGALDRWRVRLATAPAVRRRFDTWAERALEVARSRPAP
ncbi:MAG: SRPBCC family protein [Acidimicrobiia bacterium]